MALQRYQRRGYGESIARFDLLLSCCLFSHSSCVVLVLQASELYFLTSEADAGLPVHNGQHFG